MLMTDTPTTQAPPPRRSRRPVIVAVVVILALAIAGVVAAYVFLFGSEAPPAPSIDDAIRVLLPSASPE
jgi:flagellar basal body-associated protein FliL